MAVLDLFDQCAYNVCHTKSQQEMFLLWA